MFRRIIIIAGLAGLSACGSLQGVSGKRAEGGASPWSAPAASARPFSFAWRLSGDPSVAPLQVFDDGAETWLHFDRDVRLPAILGVDDQGERVLPYERRAPYVVLSEVWPELRFRGGALQAVARRDSQGSEARADDSRAEAFNLSGKAGTDGHEPGAAYLGGAHGRR